MNRSIVGRLVAKDLYLYRWLMVTALLAGVVSLVISSVSPGDNVATGLNPGVVLFMTTIIAFGIFISMLGILKERQDGSQLFVLSLPVSPGEYAIAKVWAALAAFLVPWMLLTAGVILATLVTGAPRGGLPAFVLMMRYFLANFCLLMAIIVITMSELWSIVGILATNIVLTLFLMNLGRLPGIAGHSQDAAATWAPAATRIMAIELAVAALSLVLAIQLPSRRKDLV